MPYKISQSMPRSTIAQVNHCSIEHTDSYIHSSARVVVVVVVVAAAAAADWQFADWLFIVINTLSCALQVMQAAKLKRSCIMHKQHAISACLEQVSMPWLTYAKYLQIHSFGNI